MKKTDIRERLKTQQMVLEIQDQMNKLLISNKISSSKPEDDNDSKI